MIRKIYKTSLFVLIPIAIVSAFFEWKKLPVSIVTGGLLGLLNMKGLAWGVEGIFGSTKISGPMIAFSFFRLMLLMGVIVILIYYRLVNVLGILIGFTVIFTITLIEGFKYAKNLEDK
jgi:hypothetical protein